MNSFLQRNKSRIIQVSILILITVILRLPIFFVSHFNNDELIHIALAKKLDDYGLKSFNWHASNLNNYNLFFMELGYDPIYKLIGIDDGDEKIGSLLRGFLGEREWLSHHPPGYPFFVAASHKMFSSNLPFVLNNSNNQFFMKRNMRLQFYACIVSFLFSLFLVMATYILGSKMFSHKIGLFSAFFMSLTPIELLTANKIWADDMTAFFVVLAAMLYLYALKNKRPTFSLISGFFCGLSILTKMSGTYIIFVVIVSHLFEHRNDKVTARSIFSFLFDRNILYFLSGVFIVSAWWIDLYWINLSGGRFAYHLNLNPLSSQGLAQTLGWNKYFNVTYSRPWYSYFLLVPFQFPIYLLSYVFIFLFLLRNTITAFKNFVKESTFELRFLIIWLITAFIFLTLKPNKEIRYMLIAFPAIAILSSYFLFRLFELAKSKKYKKLIYGFVTILSSLSLLSVVRIGIRYVILRADFIKIPL